MTNGQLRRWVIVGLFALAGGFACRSYNGAESSPTTRTAGARQEGPTGPGYGGESTTFGRSIDINGTLGTQAHNGVSYSANQVQTGGIGTLGMKGPQPLVLGWQDSRSLFGQNPQVFFEKAPAQGVGGAAGAGSRVGPTPEGVQGGTVPGGAVPSGAVPGGGVQSAMPYSSEEQGGAVPGGAELGSSVQQGTPAGGQTTGAPGFPGSEVQGSTVMQGTPAGGITPQPTPNPGGLP